MLHSAVNGTPFSVNDQVLLDPHIHEIFGLISHQTCCITTLCSLCLTHDAVGMASHTGNRSVEREPSDTFRNSTVTDVLLICFI